MEVQLELDRSGDHAVLDVRARGAGGRARLHEVVSLLHADGTIEHVPIVHVEAREGVLVLTGASDGFTATAMLRIESGGHVGIELDVTCTAEAVVEAGLRFELALGECGRPDWLIPGCFYGENRPKDARSRYPRFVPDGGDVDQLESSWWSFRCDRAATPVVIGWDEDGGAALEVPEQGELGLNGLGLALVDGHPVLRVHAPYREEPVHYTGGPFPAPAEAPTHRWIPGDTVVLRLRATLLPPERDSYAPLLRTVHQRLAATSTGRGEVAWLDAARAADHAAHGLYRWHYVDDPPMFQETAAFDRQALGTMGDREAMHVAWVSGTPVARALLRHGRRVGSDEYVEAAIAVLDFIAGGRTPGGTFWGQFTQRSGWHHGWHAEQRRLHARTLADATLFMLRALEDERAHGAEHPGWEEAIRSNLDVAIRSQREDGTLASALDVNTGDDLDWRGTAGLAWVAPLVEAASALDEPRYAVAARAAGAAYLEVVRRDGLFGAPEDVDLAPTSEDGYMGVMAYIALHELEPENERWLEAARRAADWTLTFRYAYDVQFPEHTILASYGYRTRGADQASPVKQHIHTYALVCQPEWTRLAAHLGDPWYLERAREAFANARQLVARRDGDFGAQRGMVSERMYQTDHIQSKGMLLTLSHAWCVGLLLDACEDAILRPGVVD